MEKDMYKRRHTQRKTYIKKDHIRKEIYTKKNIYKREHMWRKTHTEEKKQKEDYMQDDILRENTYGGGYMEIDIHRIPFDLG